MQFTVRSQKFPDAANKKATENP